MQEHTDTRVETHRRSLREGIDQTLQAWQRDKLPILDKESAIRTAFRNNDRILLEAETGSGKSTAAPVLLLDELIKNNPRANIVVSQPRRIATEDLSDYVGKNLGSNFVGFHHKLDRSITSETQITYTVEKSLLNELTKDPALLKYDAVVLDEIHEWSVDLGILLPLLVKAQEERKKIGRPLKLVLTSATVDRKKITNKLTGIVQVEVPGRTHHVEEFFTSTPKDDAEIPAKAAEQTASILAAGDPNTGDILIFMPGDAEIRQTKAALEEKIKDPNVEIITLQGGDKNSDAYKKNSGKRKIIIASNVAETSITIPTVRTVIDSGLMRRNVYNKATGMSELLTLRHTQSNALQRKGRAGRTSSGKVYFLFSEKDFHDRDQHLKPQMLETNPVPLVLQLKHLGIGNVHDFDYIDHPGREKLDQAVESLTKLGALDNNGNITAIGKQMVEYDLDPHYARMLVEAEKRKCSDSVGILVGLMNSKASLYNIDFKPGVPFSKKYKEYVVPDSDFLTVLNIWNDYIAHNKSKEDRQRWSDEKGINTFAFYKAENTRNEFHRGRRGAQSFDLSDSVNKNITASLTLGLVDNILTRNLNKTYVSSRFISADIKIDRNSVISDLRPSKIISGSMHFNEKTGEAYASYNSEFNAALLAELAPQMRSLAVNRETALTPVEKSNHVTEPAVKITTSLPQDEPEISPPAPRLTRQETKDETIKRVISPNVFRRIAHFASSVGESINSIFSRIRKFLRI